MPAEDICRALAVLAAHSVSVASLDLASCSLTGVPAALSHLTGLSKLSLYNNKLRGGWQHLLPLQQLQDLELGWCYLPEVPQALSHLTNLTSLSLSSNHQLGGGGGWQHLWPLHQLRTLDLCYCCLAEVPRELSELGATISI